MAVIDTSTIGTPTNSITFNNYLANPLYRLIRRSGPTRREIREFDIALPESSGVSDFQTFVGKEYMVLEGKLYPDNEQQFASGREALNKLASLEIEQADSSSDQGYVPYVYTEGIQKQIALKALYVDMPESTRQGIVQPFKIVCKIKYPVAHSTQAKTATLNTVNVTPIGGTVIPTLVPMTIGPTGTTGTTLPVKLPVALGASATTGGATATNAGSLSSFPTIQVYGPVNRPRITNVTTGEYIEWNTTLGTSDSITATYNQENISMTGVGGANIYGLLTSGSTLFRVRPGINNFTLTGSSLGVGAYATVNFLDSYPIS